jgi:hypothetical protein
VSRVAIFALAFVLAAAACGCEITLPGSDAGAGSDASSGAGDASTSQTVGDQCTTIFTELCSQAIRRCGLQGFTLDQCISANMPTCCSGSVCGETSRSSPDQVTACTQALDAEDCNALVNDTTPPACQGVPQRPSS